jgi:hypothetical protein
MQVSLIRINYWSDIILATGGQGLKALAGCAFVHTSWELGKAAPMMSYEGYAGSCFSGVVQNLAYPLKQVKLMRL